MIGVERFVSWQSVMARWPRLSYHDTSAESDAMMITVKLLIVEMHCWCSMILVAMPRQESVVNGNVTGRP